MNYFSSNSRVIFLPGIHTADTNRSIVIANASNITLEGSGSTIQCTKDQQLGLVFMGISNLSILNISLHQCGALLPEAKVLLGATFSLLMMSIAHTNDLYTKSSPALYLIAVSNVTIFRVSIYNSTGPGLLALNVIGHSIIFQSSFIRNSPNCALTLMDTISSIDVLQKVLFVMLDTEFLFGKSIHSPFAAGLSVYILQTSYKISINISNSILQNNDGFKYGNVLFYMDYCQRNHVAIHIYGMNCSHSNHIGLALNIHPILFWPVQCETAEQYNVMNIVESYFGQNTHAIKVWSSVPSDETITITLENILFHSNSLALSLQNTYYAVLSHVIFFKNTAETLNVKAPIKIENSNVEIQGVSTFRENRGYAAAVMIEDSSVKFRGNTTFLRNRGKKAGAMYVEASQLHFEDDMQFVENEGYDGGAIAFIQKATATVGFYELTIGSTLRANFINNHARHYGGAIYITHLSVGKLQQCFYKPKFYNRFGHRITSIGGLMSFTNNTSTIAGSAIYGGWVKMCFIHARLRDLLLIPSPGYLYFNQLFQIRTNTSDLSPVSSASVRVCICSYSKPICNVTHHTITAYPGETFHVSAVGVGQMYGTVPSTIHARFRQTNTSILSELDNLQRVSQFCSNLSYVVRSSNTAEDIILTVESNINQDIFKGIYDVHPKKQFDDVIVHVELRPCPLGFIMERGDCICHPQLQALGVECSISTGTIYREVQQWFNATFNHKGVPTGFLVHEHCPFDYCKPYSLNLSLENPDEQCAFHRSGILCGACQHNLSHVLGSSNCKECSSLWLILFIPVIAVAGIALVVFLMLLNLTVSVGTINGLIFYANIVRANQAIFFPHSTNNSFLSLFIAWMNLDLGFEVCLYDGLGAYTKTWLQFVFPIYIWLVVIMIIVSSHYYTTAAKLSGNNAVQILATLFLLSYAKLLRLTITILSSTTLEYPDGSVRRVWLYDGNVDYLKGKHVPLFMAALLVLLVLSLPYTALLLFIQCLQLKTKYRVLFWIGKFKPLFDAYTGPYKDKHRYWTGLLLLVRAVLFLIFSVNVFGEPAINMLAITSAILSILLYVAVSQHVYKSKALNMLEYALLFNLGITSVISVYSTLTRGNQAAPTYTSVGIAFFIFCVIVLYHTGIRIKGLCQQNQCSRQITNAMNTLKLKTSNSRRQNENENSSSHPNRTAHPPGNPQVPVTFIELREPLLEHCENN